MAHTSDRQAENQFLAGVKEEMNSENIFSFLKISTVCYLMQMQY